MKFLVVFFAVVALCAGSAIPLVPKDNSHYVEGESRYIWMPDGDGNPLLVDLHAPVDESDVLARNGARNEYWLFTRRNRNNRQILVNGNANSIRNSQYNGNRPTKVIIHGWNSNGNTNMVPEITNAYLLQADVNVIVLDWRRDAAGPLYSPAARAVPGVGRTLTNFLNFVFNTAGGNWNNVHIMGHSLGAHVAGHAGRAAGGRAARVTGFDPAGPEFTGSSNALNKNDGVYVESIHTNGGSLGIMRATSDVDFYANGGKSQPGCGINVACSHGRAPLLFASSINFGHLIGRRCSNVNQAENGICTGATLPLGNPNLGKRGQGIYALRTGSAWPY